MEEAKLLKKYVQFSQELFDQICSNLSEGLSLRTVCSLPGMPDKSNVFRWLREKPGLRDQYARAKDEAADAIAEDMLDIADDASNDFMTIHKGDIEYEVEHREVTSRSKLRVETRQWYLSKLKPKKYGNNLDITSGGDKIKQPPIFQVIDTKTKAICESLSAGQGRESDVREQVVIADQPPQDNSNDECFHPQPRGVFQSGDTPGGQPGWHIFLKNFFNYSSPRFYRYNFQMSNSHFRCFGILSALTPRCSP